MTEEKAINLIFEELVKAEKKFPGWHLDPVHAGAVVGEEAGELIQATLDFYFCREKSRDKMIKEAAQTGAMAMRFLMGVDECERKEVK